MKKWGIVCALALLATLNLRSQEVVAPQKNDDKRLPDTIQPAGRPDVVQRKTDSIIALERNVNVLSVKDSAFKPNPKKAVIMAAAFPGLGQIYNRKYWKLPILYGGFIGFSYAISWNNDYYQKYFNGYHDIIDKNPDTNKWKDLLPYGTNPSAIDEAWFTGVLKRRKDFYKRSRDLSIIGAVALYGLSILDAYVDAQLFDFDISPDLSMRLEPALLERNNRFSDNAFGIQCRLNF